MDNAVLVSMMKDILFIHDEDDNYKDDSRYVTLNTSRTEETLFATKSPAVRLQLEEAQEPRVVRSYIEKLYQHLQVDTENVNLVDTSLFKVKRYSRNKPLEFLFEKRTWDEEGKKWVENKVFLTDKQNGKFKLINILKKTFGSG